MVDREPVSVRNCTSQYDDDRLRPVETQAVIPWAEARERLESSEQYWLASIGPGGRPHVRPVLAVWVDGALYSTTNPGTRKARNLAERANCSVSVSRDGLDLVVEGTATRVGDGVTLQAVADAFHSKYGWPVVVRAGAFTAPYGAPTAGPPPYEAYSVVPAVVFGFGTDERFATRSTRWAF